MTDDAQRDPWHEDGTAPSSNDLRMAALGMLDARRAMRGLLPADVIQDVAFEMLLELFAAGAGGVAVDRLLSDQSVPGPRARRWLDALKAHELASTEDGDVRLTSYGERGMLALLNAVVRSQRRLRGWGRN